MLKSRVLIRSIEPASRFVASGCESAVFRAHSCIGLLPLHGVLSQVQARAMPGVGLRRNVIGIVIGHLGADEADRYHGETTFEGITMATVRVLFVCLGNICRSPTAEGVLRKLLQDEAPTLDVQIDSAGTAAYHVGEAPDSRSIVAASCRQVDLKPQRARSLRREDFREFDLILAMDQDNLRVLNARRPGNARAVVKLFMEYAPQCGTLEVPDPYFGDADGFERVLDLTAAASRGLLPELQDRAQQPVESTRKSDRHGQRKYPSHQEIADG